MRIYEIGVQFKGETYHTGIMKCSLNEALAVITRMRSQTIFDRFTLRSYCIYNSKKLALVLLTRASGKGALYGRYQIYDRIPTHV